jgi:pyruvate kinase
MDVAALNFSHGTAEQHAETARSCARPPAAPGAPSRSCRTSRPEAAHRRAADGIAELKPGDHLTFVCGDTGERRRRRMTITWAGLADASSRRDHVPRRRRDPPARDRTRAGDGEIDAEVEVGGTVASRQGLNIPGETTALPRSRGGPRAPARRREDRRRPRRAVVRAPRRGRHVRARAHALPLIAKIEKPQAVERAEEIVRAADCVMVARGDLGIELPIEEVPIVQKKPAGRLPAVRAALDHRDADARLDGQLVAPTRAEVADVANAILDGTDA